MKQIPLIATLLALSFSLLAADINIINIPPAGGSASTDKVLGVTNATHTALIPISQILSLAAAQGISLAFTTNQFSLSTNGSVVTVVIKSGASVTNLTGSLSTVTITNGSTFLGSNGDAGLRDVSVRGLTVTADAEIQGTISGNGGGITNIPATSITYSTNTSTMAPNFNLPYSRIGTNAGFTFLAPLNVSNTVVQTCVILVTNITGSAVLVLPPTNVHTNGVWYITNATVFTFWNYGSFLTNATALPLY